MYEKYFKRLLDFVLSLLALIVLSPLLIILSAVGAVAMKGNPFFVQPRPGKKDKTGNEKIFRLFKLRSMSNKRDANGQLLPDDMRLGKYGAFLRSTSADELPSLVNILIGNLSIVGPRPQLVRDMVFMTPKERKRHDVRPGLTGLAQVSGRNALGWKLKLKTDLEYISKITFFGDLKIIIKTIKQVFFKEKGLEGADVDEVEITDDYGDYLLKRGMVSADEYNKKQAEALEILKNLNKKQAGDLV